MTQASTQDARPLIRLSALAKRIGLSGAKLRDDARRGELRVFWVKCGSRKLGLVAPAEAERYLHRIGIAITL